MPSVRIAADFLVDTILRSNAVINDFRERKTKINLGIQLKYGYMTDVYKLFMKCKYID